MQEEPEVDLCIGERIKRQVIEVLDSVQYSREYCIEHGIDASVNLGMVHIKVSDMDFVLPGINK